MNLRILQAGLLGLLLAGAGFAWRALPTPSLPTLRDVAQDALRTPFGDGARLRAMALDPAEALVLDGLEVPALQEAGETTARPGLSIRRARIRHDAAALAQGRLVPLDVEVEGAVLHTHETEAGIAADFPIDLPEPSGSGAIPAVRVRHATVHYRARADSSRLASGANVVVVLDNATMEPTGTDRVTLRGTVSTQGLGQDAEPIRIFGFVDLESEAFTVTATQDHLELTPELLQTLHPDIAAPLRQDSIRGGAIEVTIQQAPPAPAQLTVDWDADVEVQVRDLPGTKAIEAETREQLQELFGQGIVKLSLDEGVVNIERLVSEMAGGQVEASGVVDPEAGTLALDFRIQDLDLEDPAVRRALGEEGTAIFEQFAPAGIVDAVGHVSRTEDGKTSWRVDVLLESASFEFIGEPGPTGQMEGFPYRVEQAAGRVRLRPEGIFFDDIVGFHRGAEITVRGHGRKAWSGGETGRILLGHEGGADIRLTVEVLGLKVDEDLQRAVAGSEFAGLLDEFQLGGVIDRVEVDVLRVPGVDTTAKTEVRLSLEGESFRYAPFPLPLEDVRGTITLRRPLQDDRTRGRTYDVAVTGWAEGAPVEVAMQIREPEGRGRLTVKAKGIPLAGGLGDAILASPKTADSLGEVWQWLAPRGRADVVATFPVSDDPDPLTVDATLRGGSIRLAANQTDQPLELEGLRGRIQVAGERITLHDVRGTLGNATVDLAGEMAGGVEGRWALDLRTTRLRLDDTRLAGLDALVDLGSLLPEGLRLMPGAQAALAITLLRAPGAHASIEAHVIAEQVDATLDVADAGEVQFQARRLDAHPKVLRFHDARVRAQGVDAQVISAVLGLEEDGPPFQGTFRVTLDDLDTRSRLMGLVPERIRDALGSLLADRQLRTSGIQIHAPPQGALRLEGPLELVVPEGASSDESDGGPRGRVTFEPLLISTDPAGTLLSGRVGFHGFGMEAGVALDDVRGQVVLDRLRLGDAPQGSGRLEGLSGRVEGVRFQDLRAPLLWNGGFFQADPITGRVVGGRLLADVRVHTRAPTAYEGRFQVEDFDVALLQADLAPTGAPYKGLGTARVEFQNRGGSLASLTARGQIRIRDGDLGELPVVANVFALLAEILSTDERPHFEQAAVDFTLEDEVFTLHRADLVGPLFELPGRGTVDTGGVADLVFTPDILKSLAVPGLLQVPVVGDVVGAVFREDLLYAVRLRGDLGSADPEIVPFPGLGLDRRPAFEGTGPQELPPRRVPRLFR